MEAFLIYLLKSSGIIALFLLFYILFLKRETFFRANRIYLLAGLGFAILVPFMVFTKTIWLSPTPLYQIQIPDELIVAPATKNPINWISLILYGYYAGVFLFAIRFVVQLLSLKKLMESGKKIREGKFIRIETNQKSSPFSFFSYLVYNPTFHTSSELKTILGHEKVHAEERHSLDMLAMQLFTIFQWCNPFVWCYRACLNDNLEYVADTETIAKNTDRTEYQYLLLQTGMGKKHYPMATPFFTNSIKKRIVMLNKNRSDRKNSFKYALMLPLLAGFIFLFNVKTEAQILPNPTSTNTESPQTDNIPHPSKNENEYNPITYDKEHTGDFMDHNPNDIKAVSEAEKIVAPSKILKPEYYVDDKNPLYLVDGKEISKSDFDKIDINWIKSTYVWKGQQAIDKFGNKGKNGAREIILKKDYLNIPRTKYPNDPKVRPSAFIVQDPIDSNPNATGILANHPDGGELVILDGKEVPYNMINSVRPESIGSIKVWKGQQAIDKYGDRGKNGVIEIILKRNYQFIPNTKNADNHKVRRPSMLIIHDSIDGRALVVGKASGIVLSNQDKGELVILNGKEVPFSTIDSLKPESIETVSVWKGEKAIDKYGDKGKNGVIEIVTKKE